MGEDHDEEAGADEAAPTSCGILLYFGSPGINLDEAPLAIYVLLNFTQGPLSRTKIADSA